MSPALAVHLENLRVEQSEPIVKRNEDKTCSRVEVADKGTDICGEGSDSVNRLCSDNCSPDENDDENDCQVTIVAHVIPYELYGQFGSDPSAIRTINTTSEQTEVVHKSYIRKTMKRALLSQCMINAVIMAIVTAGGMPIGYSAILLPQLQSPNSTLPTDDNWASWIASVHSTAAPMGSILAGPMMDRWGRRTILHLSLLPMIAGWTLMSLAPNHIVLIIGRILAGFAVGMIPGSSQVLIGEISDPALRGLFSSMPSASYALGILLVYAAGSKFHWRVVAMLGTVLPVFGAVGLFFLPESPVWSVNKNKTEEAKKCLMLIRGGNIHIVNQELNILTGHIKMENDKEKQMKSEYEDTMCAPVPHWWDIMTRPEVCKPFFIILTFCLLQILSGSYVAIFYGVTLIASASGTSSRDFDCLTIAVMTALVRFVTSIVTSVCLLKLGRRKIGIISGIGTAISCSLLVVFLYWKKGAVGEEALPNTHDTYIIAALIMTYVAMNTFGIFSLPVMMIGEVLPSNVRGSVSGILLMLINLMIFSTTKVYPSVASVLGSIGVFSAFTIVSLLITVYVYLFLPETRDRPLTQIEEYFAVGKNLLWRNRDRELTRRRPLTLF